MWDKEDRYRDRGHWPPPPGQWGRGRVLLAVLAVLAILALIFVLIVRPLWPTGSGPTSTATPHSGNRGASAAMPSGDLPGWRQVFADDFSGGALGSDWISYEGQPAGDPGGWFSPSHVSVGAGTLTIGAWRESARNDLYVTGGISNRAVFSQTYGRYDIRFRMDQGRGIAYAILLWPSSNKYPPEIDIAEDNGQNRDSMHASMHSADGQTRVDRDIKGDFSQWHTAGLRWTPKKLEFTLDGKVWATMTGSQVPAQPMSLAIQSQAWYCGHSWEACPDASTPSRVNLEVDWAVAYARQE